MNRCDEELVKKILAENTHVEVDGLDIEIKSLPDDDREGVLDKREFFIRNAIYAFQKMAPAQKFDVAMMRAATKTQCLDVCKVLLERFGVMLEVARRFSKEACYGLYT